ERVGERDDEPGDRYEPDQHPGDQRGGGGADRFPVFAVQVAGEQRDDQGGERATGDDLEDDVRDAVRRLVHVGQVAVPDGLPQHERAREPGDPAGQREYRDERGGVRDPAPPGSGRSALGGHGQARRRPSASSSRRPGVLSMTLVKLTRSLAAVSPASPASRTARPAVPVRAASATPSSAPSALAPASPSMMSSPRSSGSSAAAAPTGPAARSAPAAPIRRPDFSARPGRRSSRLTRFAVPAMTPAP